MGMKTLLIIAFMAVFCTACQLDDEYIYNVDPRLEYYVDRFYTEADSRKISLQRIDLTVSVMPIIGDQFTHGVTDHENNSITINESFFLYSDSSQIEYCVFHEMGHLLLNRRHEPLQNYSIMIPEDWYSSDYELYPNKRQELINELFKPHKIQ